MKRAMILIITLLLTSLFTSEKILAQESDCQLVFYDGIVAGFQNFPGDDPTRYTGAWDGGMLIPDGQVLQILYESDEYRIAGWLEALNGTGLYLSIMKPATGKSFKFYEGWLRVNPSDFIGCNNLINRYDSTKLLSGNVEFCEITGLGNNVRSIPSTEGLRTTTLLSGYKTAALAGEPDGEYVWYLVALQNDYGFGWVRNDTVTVTGDCSALKSAREVQVFSYGNQLAPFIWQRSRFTVRSDVYLSEAKLVAMEQLQAFVFEEYWGSASPRFPLIVHVSLDVSKAYGLEDAGGLTTGGKNLGSGRIDHEVDSLTYDELAFLVAFYPDMWYAYGHELGHVSVYQRLNYDQNAQLSSAAAILMHIEFRDAMNPIPQLRESPHVVEYDYHGALPAGYEIERLSEEKFKELQEILLNIPYE
jgi:hypothetical protein